MGSKALGRMSLYMDEQWSHERAMCKAGSLELIMGPMFSGTVLSCLYFFLFFFSSSIVCLWFSLS